MPTWMILCLVPAVLLTILLLGLGIVLAYESITIRFQYYLQQHGRKAQGVIVESEQYKGDGLHPADPCFKGKFEFQDHRSKRHRGKFSRYCFEPYDFAYSDYSFQDAVAAYSKGSIIDVYYLSWFPAIHKEHIHLRKTTD